MKHHLVRLALCVVVSLVLHWLLLKNWEQAEKNKQNAAAGGAQAMKIKIQEPLQPAPPPKAPVAMPKNDAKAQNNQTTSNDPDLEENDGSPPPSEKTDQPQEKPVEPAEEPAAEEPPADAPKGVNLESNKKTAAVTKAQEDSAKDDSKKTTKEVFNETITKLRNENKKVIQTQLSASEYKSYIQNLKIGKMKGVKVPKLEIIYTDLQDIFAQFSYFRIKVLAIEPKTFSKTHDVVEVQNLGTNDISFQFIKKFDFSKYSSRFVAQRAPFFITQKKKIENRGFLPGDLALYSVTPTSVDNYFRYKQNEVIKQNGYKPDDVVMTLCRGHKTSFGSYILKVESIVLRDQRTVDVKDFEYAKLTGAQ